MLASDLSKAITQAGNLASLDLAAKRMWSKLADGSINDGVAELLSSAADARRAALKGYTGQAASKSPTPRPKPCRSPHKAKSIARRRGLAASGAVPGTIAANFTTGEIAALTVIARQCQRRSSCEWFMDRIAAVAGVSRTTARNALRQAQALGLISVQERRLTAWRSESNIIRIVSAEWLAWLGLGGGRKKAISTNTHSYSYSEKRNFLGSSGDKFAVCSSVARTALVPSRHDRSQSDYRLACDT